MATKLNPYLTPAMHRFLVTLRDSKDQYAISEGLSCMIDGYNFHRGTVLKLLRLCLLSKDQFSHDATEIWTLNEEGRTILKDLTYVPLIVEALKGKLHA